MLPDIGNSVIYEILLLLSSGKVGPRMIEDMISSLS
jgi:hypothetical protein